MNRAPLSDWPFELPGDAREPAREPLGRGGCLVLAAGAVAALAPWAALAWWLA